MRANEQKRKLAAATAGILSLAALATAQDAWAATLNKTNNTMPKLRPV